MFTTKSIAIPDMQAVAVWAKARDILDSPAIPDLKIVAIELGLSRQIGGEKSLYSIYWRFSAEKLNLQHLEQGGWGELAPDLADPN